MPKSQGELPAAAPTDTAPAGQSTPIFLKSLTVVGAHTMTPQELAPMYASLVGHQVTLDQVNGVAAAIAKRYRDAGYILVQAFIKGGMELDPAGADVVIQVVEGYIDKIAYADNSYADGSRGRLIRGYVEQIPRSCYLPPAEGDTLPCPLNERVLERYLLLAKDLGGVDVDSVLVPGEQPGSASLFVTIKERHVEGFANVNNRGTRFVGPVQRSVGMNLHDLTGLYETMDLQYEDTEHSGELNYYSLDAALPIGSQGLLASFDAGYSISKPGYTLAPADVRTTDRTLMGVLAYPLIRSRARNLTLKASLSALDDRTTEVGQLSSEDRLRVIGFDVTYDHSDGLWGGGVGLLDFQVSQGLRGLGASNQSSTLLARTGASIGFTKLNLTASRMQSLNANWSVLGEATAQYSSNRLLPTEEFGFGGERFGRGYDPSELLGDSGIAARTEVRYSPVLDLSWVQSTEVYGFYDAGAVYNAPPCGCGTPPPRHAGAESAGFGDRSNFSRWISGFVELAKPLTHIPSVSHSKDVRGFAGLSIWL